MKPLPRQSKISWRIPVCDCCEKRAPLIVMLTAELWAKVATHKREILCLSCIEKRLDRPVNFSDLKDCGVTRQMLLGAAIHSRSTGSSTFSNYLEE